MARLPIPGSDEGTWGDILNDYLLAQHSSAGIHPDASSSSKGFIRLNRDLSGSAQNPTVIGLQGRNVASTAPTDGYVLTWNSAVSRWEPAVGAATDASGGNKGTVRLADDFGGTADNPRVTGLRGRPLSVNPPALGHYLAWNNSSSEWEPGPLPDSASGVKGIVRLTGDFAGTADTPVVQGLQGRSVVNTAPTDGQVLAWNNTATQWEPQTVSGGGGGGGDALFVAASDAAPSIIAKADYVCDGTNDEVEIQAAIDALSSGNGGRVILSEGGFNIIVPDGGAAITVASGVTIQGAGGHFSTYVQQNNTNTASGGILFQISNYTMLRDIGIYCYDDVKAVRVTDYNSWITIENCYLDGERELFHSNGSNNLRLRNNTFNNFSNSNSNVLMQGSARDIWIQGNRFDSGNHAIEINGPAGSPAGTAGRIIIRDNYFFASGFSNIYIDGGSGAPYTTITGNHSQGAGYNWSGGADPIAFAYLVGTTNDQLSNSAGEENGTVVSNNSIENINGGYGVYLLNIEGAQVLGNYIEDIEFAGVGLSNSSHNVIANNLLFWTGQGWPGNTYDSLLLTSDSNSNLIHHNMLRDDEVSSLNARYGINIATADCNDNILSENDLRGAGGGTAELNDAGTNTQIGPGTEWDLGVPSTRTDGHVITWNATNQNFELAAGGGGGGGGGAAFTVTIAASDSSAAAQASADYVCDGTDDEVQINAALAALPAAGGRIEFSSGTFVPNMTNGINAAGATQSVEIVGQGYSTLFTPVGEPVASGAVMFNIPGPATIRDFRVNDFTNLTTFDVSLCRVDNTADISGLYIEYISRHVIEVNTSTYVKVTNCTAEYFGQGVSFDPATTAFIWVDGAVTKLNVSGNHIEGGGRGVYLRYETYGLISDNDFAVEGDGVYINDAGRGSAYGRALRIVNNNFYNLGGRAVWRPRDPTETAGVAGYTVGIVIANNSFTLNNRFTPTPGIPPAPDARATPGAIELALSSGVRITGNSFERNYFADIVIHKGYATYDDLNPQGNVIADNIFDSINANDTHHSVLILSENGGGVGNMSITGNAWVISGERWALYFESFSTDYFEHVTVSNNTVHCYDTTAFYFHRLRRSSITNNVIRGGKYGNDQGTIDRQLDVSPAGQIWAQIALDECDEVLVSGNIDSEGSAFVRSASRYFIYLYNSCSDIYVTDNILKLSQGGTITPEYGLFVEAGCSDIRAIGNDFRDASTARFDDPGTVLTLTYTGGAGIGDNW